MVKVNIVFWFDWWINKGLSVHLILKVFFYLDFLKMKDKMTENQNRKADITKESWRSSSQNRVQLINKIFQVKGACPHLCAAALQRAFLGYFREVFHVTAVKRQQGSQLSEQDAGAGPDPRAGPRDQGHFTLQGGNLNRTNYKHDVFAQTREAVS